MKRCRVIKTNEFQLMRLIISTFIEWKIIVSREKNRKLKPYFFQLDNKFYSEHGISILVVNSL